MKEKSEHWRMEDMILGMILMGCCKPCEEMEEVQEREVEERVQRRAKERVVKSHLQRSARV